MLDLVVNTRVMSKHHRNEEQHPSQHGSRKNEGTPLAHWKGMEIVAGPWKIQGFPEFRHKFEFAVKAEPPAVVSADQFSVFACILDDQVAPVGADIAQAMDLPFPIF